MRTIVAALVILTGATAQATVLFTAPVNRTGETLYCNIANVGDKPINVNTEIIGVGGVVEDLFTQEIPAGSSANPGASAPPGIAASYCKFTVSTSKSSVRASYCLGDPCKTSGEAR